jgi:phospholipase/carboxylesterase
MESFLKSFRDQMVNWAGLLDIGDADAPRPDAKAKRTRGRGKPSSMICYGDHSVQIGEEVFAEADESDVDIGGEFDGQVGGHTESLKAVLMSAKAKGKTALCIWFHALTGEGADFEKALKAKIANELPWVEWYFPDAAKQPVTSLNGSIHRCWFDQLEAEVTRSMATPGLEASVSMAHALLRQAEAQGYSSNRILLGGFSQGGVLALSAGLSYENPLAGIMAVSAWVPPCFFLSRPVQQPSTPMMFAIGDQDDVILLPIFQESTKKLKQAGCSRVTTKVYPGLDHTWKLSQSQDVKQFIQSVAKNH